MKVVLADCRHYGYMLRQARQNNHISRSTAAQILHISISQLQQYERGREIIPEQVMLKILHYGLLLLNARRIAYIPNDKK